MARNYVIATPAGAILVQEEGQRVANYSGVFIKETAGQVHAAAGAVVIPLQAAAGVAANVTPQYAAVGSIVLPIQIASALGGSSALAPRRPTAQRTYAQTYSARPPAISTGTRHGSQAYYTARSRAR